MHASDDEFEPVVDNLVRVLAPGGRFAAFDLDYGAIILAPGGADKALVAPRHRDALRVARPAARRTPAPRAAG